MDQEEGGGAEDEMVLVFKPVEQVEEATTKPGNTLVD